MVWFVVTVLFAAWSHTTVFVWNVFPVWMLIATGHAAWRPGAPAMADEQGSVVSRRCMVVWC